MEQETTFVPDVMKTGYSEILTRSCSRHCWAGEARFCQHLHLCQSAADICQREQRTCPTVNGIAGEFVDKKLHVRSALMLWLFKKPWVLSQMDVLGYIMQD